MAMLRRIENRQPAVPQRDSAGFIDPVSVIVGASMGQPLGHLFDQTHRFFTRACRGEFEKASKPTHAGYFPF